MKRKIEFQNDHLYHVFNRGVDKRQIFDSDRDYIRFIESIRDFNNTLSDTQRKHLKSIGAYPPSRPDLDVSRSGLEGSQFEPIVEIICYCLLPNHFHFVLRQLTENGVSDFMRKLSTGYTGYFNKKNERSGHLFQGVFKAVPIKSDEQLLYLSGYVNGNAEVHKITKAQDWPWSSCQDYLGIKDGKMCNKEVILKEFKSADDYKEYLNEVIAGASQRKEDVIIYE